MVFVAVYLIGIPCSRATITITTSNPTSVQSGIVEAYQTGQSSITVPAGTYYLPSISNQNWHLYFSNMTRSFTINAQGAVFVCTDRTKRSIAFENCSYVTFKGATFLRQTIPFSQGTIQTIASDRTWVDIQIAAGYPTDITNTAFFSPAVFNVFDPVNGELKLNVPNIYITKMADGVTPWIESRGNNVFRFHCTSLTGNPGSTIQISPGDLAAWRGVPIHDLNVRNCQNMTFSSLVIKGGAGIAAIELWGNGNNYYNYTLTYPPLPAGATQKPLLSSNADGFHSSGAVNGPTLNGCVLEGMNDDGVAIHGNYALVMQPASGNTVIVDWPGIFLNFPFAQVGDTLRFYGGTFALADETTVTGITELTNYTPPQPISNAYRSFYTNTPRYFLLTLSQPVAAQTYWAISNINRIGDGFTLTNNVIRSTRAHGLIIKSTNGLIQNNTIENTVMAGIAIAPELQAWGEADYSRGLTIYNNVLSRTGIGRQASWNGALSIVAHEYGQYVPIPGGHRDIAVENNIFKNNDGINILISSADSIQVTDNLFVNPMQAPVYQDGTNGGDISALIWITQSTNVALSRNILGNPGTSLLHMIEGTSTGTGTGFADGVIQRADAVAGFNGGTTSVVDAYPGLVGNGWKEPWKVVTGSCTMTNTSTNSAPMEPHGDYYLSSNLTTTSASGSCGTVYRRVDSAVIDMAKPHRFLFDVRINKVTSDMRYTICDQVGGANAGTGPADSWTISGINGRWQFWDGNANAYYNLATGVATITEGAVYHFIVDVDPASRSWQATLRTGTTVATTAVLGFRSTSAIDGEYLLFNIMNSTGTNINNFSWDMDNISVLQYPGILANFSGGATSVVDAYPGVAGGGWLDTWKIASNSATVTASATNTLPVDSLSGYYLSTQITTITNAASCAAIYRRFDGSANGIDVTRPHRFSFTIRVDKTTSDMRYAIFDRIGGASVGTDASNTWAIIGTSAGWQFYNGNTGGYVNPTSGAVPVIQGAVYSFIIDVDPANKSWTGTVQCNGNIATTSTLGFRANSTVDGEYLEFGVANLGTTNINPYSFSVDNISITSAGLGTIAANIPAAPPAPALLSAVARRTHGSSGNFDIPINFASGTSAPPTTAVECRSGNQVNVVLAFNKAVNSVTATLAAGSATVGSPNYDSVNKTVTVPLTDVANAQKLQLNFSNIRAADSGVLVNAVVTCGYLIGDADGDGYVTSADAVLERNNSGLQAGQPGCDFRADVNADGYVTSADAVIVRNYSGTQIL